MRRLVMVFFVLVELACLLSGCATSYEGDLARLLTELDALDPVTASASGVNDAQVEPPLHFDSETNVIQVAEIITKVAAPRLPGVDPTQREMTIHPNCLLQISVAEDPSLNSSYSVNDIGAVELGYVGPVILFNKTEKEAANKVRDVLINRDFRTATVKVRILRASYGNVRITGAVRSPGHAKVGAGDTISLNDALLRVGGLSPDAMRGRVRVYRGGMLSAMPEAAGWEEYYLETESGKPTVPEVELRINDLALVIPQDVRGGQATATTLSEKIVLVLGEVGKPGFQRFGSGEPCTLMHLLFRISLPPFANKKSIRVVRRDESGFEQEFSVNAEKLLETGAPEDDFVLENGDRIIVPARRFTLL